MGDVADFVNEHTEQVSDTLREALASLPYIDSILPPRPPPPPPPPVLPASASILERTQDWIVRHKILTGLLIAATGTVAYKSYRSNVLSRKPRKARRSGLGGRMDVVVVAGSPSLPLTRSLALDLERKGFVVAIVCRGAEEEVLVRKLTRPDIKPLNLDITDPLGAGNSIEGFAQYLQAAHSAVPGGKKFHVSLKAVLLIPSLSYQTSPIATIPPSSFADLFNTHLLQPILTIQAFLPLLTTRIGPADRFQPPKVLVFTPSIISSISPPFHAPEATVCSALSAFTEVLAAELRPLAIPVTHVQLGTFDFSGFTPRSGGGETLGHAAPRGLLPSPEGLDTTAWPDSARQAFGKNYVSQSSSAISAGRIRGMRGGALTDLYSAVFDVIDGSDTSGVVRVGLGATVYGFVGRFVPRSMVAWMMGIRRVDELAAWQSSVVNSPARSAGGGDEDEEGGGSEGAAHESFVAVPHLDAGQVWRESDSAESKSSFPDMDKAYGGYI